MSVGNKELPERDTNQSDSAPGLKQDAVPKIRRNVEFRPAWVYISYTKITEIRSPRGDAKETVGANDV